MVIIIIINNIIIIFFFLPLNFKWLLFLTVRVEKLP